MKPQKWAFHKFVRGRLAMAGLVPALLAVAAFAVFHATAPPSRSTLQRSERATPWNGLLPLEAPASPPASLGEAEGHYRAGMADYRSGDYATASISFRKGTEVSPANSDLRLYLGATLLMTNDIQAAVQELKTASQLARDDQQELALLLLAKAQMDRGDSVTARQTLSQAAATGGAWSGKARSLLRQFAVVR